MAPSQDYSSKSSVLQAAWERGNWESQGSWAWGWVCIGVLLPVKVSAGCPFLLSCHISALSNGLGPAGVKPVLI